MQNHVDYDVHGIVGIRVLNPSLADAAAVASQLGPLEKPLSREPDILVRFVEHLPTPQLRYLGLERQGFNDDGYFILKSSKREARVRIAFDQIGAKCEILCETGLRSVPLLMPILHLSVLKKGFVPLHASAFLYEGTGILVTGWAKGGKTEALLAFATRGAKYIGDEWVILSSDGEHMYGVPEKIRLWDWHLAYLPHVRNQVGRPINLLFKGIRWLDRTRATVSRGGVKRTFPFSMVEEVMPALKRQLNVRVDPQAIFGAGLGEFVGRPQKVFLMVSHQDETLEVEPCDPLEVAKRMIASIRYEQLPLTEHYLAFKFAFPEKRNELLEQMEEIQYGLLCRALTGKEAYIVRHPYPVSLGKLYEAMNPFCSSNGRHA